VGIAGGRENSALYFVGITEPSNNLIYLDPHLVQKSVPSAHVFNNETLWQHVGSYHCKKIKKLHIEKMCTSVAIGFYIRNYQDFFSFTEHIKDLAYGENSIISVYDKKP
jgi:cysteine protease ATG4